MFAQQAGSSRVHGLRPGCRALLRTLTPHRLCDVQTRKRLADVKAAYDPANLFRRNYNVR
ncbi:BBE domain-containing protein [Streptomyces sp. NPDC055134]